MSRHISCRYLLFYLCINAILTYGLSRRIPRRASCPSCSQDCPEALTVQLPWYPRQELNLQSGIPRDFSTNQNSLYSRLMQERMSRDRSFPQQTSEHLIFNNYHNKFPEYVDRQTTSQDDFAYEYPPVYVSPPRPFFDRSENLFLRNPRNKNSEFSLENRNFQSYTEEDEDPANKMLVAYRADRNAEPSWENSKDAFSSSIILPQRSFPKIENAFQLRRQDIFDKEKRMIEKSPANQEYDFTYLGKEYYPTNFDEIKPNYIVPQNIRKPTKNEEFFDNWDTNDSLQSSNLRQLMQTKDNFFRNPVDKQEMITEENNDYLNQNSHMFPQELNIWKPIEKEEEFFNNWNLARKNSQESADIKQLQKAENNWLYPAMNRYFDEKDAEYFENEENMNQDYFDDDIEITKDTIIRDNYNPYDLFQDINIWEPAPDEKFSDNFDFTNGNLQDVQKEQQLEIYPNKNNNYFQNEEKENINIDKAHANADQIIRPSKIHPYISNLFSRYFGNILNNLRYPAESSKTQELSKPTNNIHENSNENRNKRLFKDETIKDDAPKDPVPPTNIFYINKYNSPAVDTQNVKTNIQNETLTKFDPDLMGDIEDPPAEPTEPTSTDSPVELSTPRQQ